MAPTRRTFLQSSGLAAALGVSGLAGCNSLLGDDAAGGAFGDWQYDPSVLTATPNVVFGGMNYGQFYEMRDELPPSMQESFEVDQSEDSPVSPEDFEQIVGVAGGDIQPPQQGGMGMGSMGLVGSVAITGSFDRQALVDEVESEGEVSQSGEYEGYAVYEVPDFGETPMGGVGQDYDGTATVGVGDSAVVAGLSMAQGGEVDASGRAAAETMIDASAGNADRLSATTGPAQNVQGRVNDMLMAVGAEVDPDLVGFYQEQMGMTMGQMSSMLNGLRAGGLGADVDPETTSYKFVLVYESASAAEESGITEIFDEESASQYEEQEGIESVSVSQDGEAIVAEIAGDTQTLLEDGGPTGSFSVAPQTN